MEVEVIAAQQCDVLNATEMYTLNWLTFCYVNFTSRGRTKQRRKRREKF